MSKYFVDLSSPPHGHVVSPLLTELGAFVKEQDHGTLGWFDGLRAEAIPAAWDPAQAARLQKSAFAFLSLPDGSLLALLDTGAKAPAVVLLGSEGDRRTVASSFESFLHVWADGKTEISDLDDDESKEGRDRLKAWLDARKIEAPPAEDFDFQAWLDRAASAAG